MLANRVERGRYFDSVALMRVSRRVSELPGVEAAALMIGTPSNKALLRDAGLLAPEGERAEPNDLVIAVRAADPEAAIEAALKAFSRQHATGSLKAVASLARALELEPQSNLALISVPGEFAAREARRALERGLNAMVFSDNVPIDEEAALKRFAADKRLLLMGPDCGSALIAGAPLGFANAVPRGDIGIVSASGTGLQEVSCLIARMGGGVSHAIGVGGRDLDERVGALGMLAALDMLDADAATRTLVLVSKPPSPRVAQKVLKRVERLTKRSVVCFLGSSEAGLARTLTEAAEAALGRKVEFSPPQLEKRKGTLRGLYCGGTLAAEAEIVCRGLGAKGEFIDLGDDRYTRGRPHPMLEPELRNAHVAAALADERVAVLLFDVVIGYGAHPDPAAALISALKDRRKLAIASVTGTHEDPQGYARQVAVLREAGVIVAPSNAHAAALAAAAIS